MTSALHQAAGDYLKVRRALGSKLDGYDRLLASFVACLEAAGATTVTTELAISWATRPGEGAHPAYLGKRLCVARGFARHLQAFDPAAEVPPARLLPHRSCRAVPYLYSAQDIAALMQAARPLAPRLRAATYETLIGLVSVTGMRISEAIRLDRDDLDWDEGLLTVWHSKFGKSRELPLHPGTLGALAAYASLRDRLCPRPEAASFFVSPAGTRLTYGTVQHTFSRLVRLAGIDARPARCRPRLHDLRHAFACRTVLGWYRAGVDVQAHLPRLSAYLGHAEPSATYWYLSAVPELLALAADRREQARGARA
jgi:integrase/recombinase XerD